MAEYLRVWSKFSVTKDSATKRFKIVELPKDRFDELADLLIDYFAKQEPTFKASGIADSKEALLEYKLHLQQFFDSGAYYATVCCLDNGDDKIGNFIGASVTLLVVDDDDDESEPQTKELKKLIEVSLAMDSCYYPKRNHNLQKYLDDRGIVVRPDFRGNGIAQEFLKVRRLMCKEEGIPMTGAWMTAYGTQKAAERDGWAVTAKLNRDELGRKFGLTYESNSPSIILFMLAKV